MAHTKKIYFSQRHLWVSWVSSVPGWAPCAWLQSGGLRLALLLLSLIILGSTTNQRRFFLGKRKTSPTSQAHLNSLLRVLLPTFHWPEQVMWLSSKSGIRKNTLPIVWMGKMTVLWIIISTAKLLMSLMKKIQLDEPYEEDTTVFCLISCVDSLSTVS